MMKRQHLFLLLLGGLAALWSAAPLRAQTAIETGLATIDSVSAQAIVGFLADDELQGREAGTHGSRVAARYLMACLKEAGVQPLWPGGYLQPFEAAARERQQRGRWQSHPDSVAALKQGTHRLLHMANVLGVIPGQRADEYVVVGAHFDHLGQDPSLHADQTYNGADDNASGVSAVLQIARAFKACGQQPRRTVIIALWDGEEKGLLGSTYFVARCPFIRQVKAYLNFDMIGRNSRPQQPRHVDYFFTASHPAFGQWLKDDIARHGLRLEPDYRAWDNPTGGSDNASFARAGVPIIWYHTNGHPDYHQPSDHAPLLNWDKLTEITKAAFLAAWRMANDENY